ncbi:MAG: DUF2273 domain-containing protein [Bacillota bacterium]
MSSEKLQRFLEILYIFRGRILGVCLGLLFSLSFIYFGFIPTVFILGSIFAGYYIGKRYDQQGDLRNIIDDILPPK